MKVAVLLGAPGAGKGTAAEGVCAATKYLHVATGDMLRDAVKKGTRFGVEAEAWMKRGELVPDSTIVAIVEERLNAGSGSDSYLFDGFPRTRQQAELLEASLGKLGAKVQHVFFLDAPRELLLSRLTGRRICRGCGRNYHVVNIPPKKSGVCDGCGGELYQRADDQEATIARRLDVYNAQTEALIAWYEKRGVLTRVNSARHRDEITGEIVRVLSRS